MRRRALILLPLVLGACRGNMVQQPRADDYEASPLFADGKVLQAPPEGTVSQDAPARAAAALRPAMTPALLVRGRERYGIFCAPCHGIDGRGHGVIVARGFPAPPSLLEPRLRASPSAHIYDVVTNGYGVMYGYSARVEPADRWAIAAYVRALQQAAGVADAR